MTQGGLADTNIPNISILFNAEYIECDFLAGNCERRSLIPDLCELISDNLITL